MKDEKPNISHPNKELFPDAGITKAALADYFERIAGYMLPYIKGRPLTLRQFPEGIGKQGFFGKHAPDYFPDFIRRVEVPMHSKPGTSMKMAMAEKAADLVYFAGQNAIELHMSLSREGALECPDQIIFDLDPSTDDFEQVRTVALALKKLLDAHQVPTFVKTTGSRGVHVHIPLQVDKDFAEVKPVARKIAEKLHQEHPDLTTLEQRKEKRGSRVFIDYLRNDYGMTVIAPYSPRALKNAPVATPIDWEELEKPSLGPQAYTLTNVFRRLAQKEDPWKDFNRHRVLLKTLSFEDSPDSPD